jgi:hypothetical protein
MVGFAQLWLPTLLSAVAVFLVSSAIHMLSPWHKSDYPPLPNEAAVMDALRPLNIPPGDWFFPRPASPADMRSPEFLAKRERGPVAIMTVMPNGTRGMASNLIGWFVYLVVVIALAAHVASRLPAEASPAHVFHEVALVCFAGFALALWQMSIWWSRSWSITIKSTVDGLIYAVICGGIFAWLWPR